MFRQKRMDRRIKFICPFDLAEHQGVEPWHRSPGLSHFESLKLLDEAGPSRLSLAAEGILVTSKKARHTAICRRKSAAFCEMTLEKAFFTRAVNGCISGVVVLDVRYYNSHFDSLAPTANCISQIGCLDRKLPLNLRLKYAVLPLLCQLTAGFPV